MKKLPEQLVGNNEVGIPEQVKTKRDVHYLCIIILEWFSSYTKPYLNCTPTNTV